MTLRLLDLSSNNGVVNMSQIAGAGVSGIITKCTENVTYADPTYRPNWDAAGSLHLFRGAYQFCRIEASAGPEQQADYLLSHLEILQPGDAVVGDMETPLDASSTDYSDWALTWLERVETQIGFPPMLYSFSDFIRRHLTSTRLGKYPLWLASWGDWLPPSIGPWSSIALWQDSATSTYPGVDGPVDESLIARDEVELRALGKPAPAPPSLTVTVYKVSVVHFLRILPKVSAPHEEPTAMAVGEIVDANAAPPAGLPSRTTHWLWCKRRSTGARGYAFLPNLTPST